MPAASITAHPSASEQNALTVQRSLSAGAFRSSPIPSAIVHRHKGLVDANDQYWQTFGSQANRWIDELYEQVESPPFYWTTCMDHLWAEGQVNQFQIELVGANGSTFPVLVSGAVFENEPEPLAVLHFVIASARPPEGTVVYLLESERQQIVRTIHDNLQQMLYALNLKLQVAGKASDSTVHPTLNEADDLLRQIIRTARYLSREMASLPILKRPQS